MFLTIFGALALTPGGLWIALVTGMLAWRPVLEIVFLRGRGAVRRIEWSASGEWRIGLQHKDPGLGLLLKDSAVLGPWIFLIWRYEGRRRYALIDSSALPAFRGRLRLERT